MDYTLSLVISILLSSAGQAPERHVVDQTTLDELVSRRVREESQAREDVRRLLLQPEVRELADRLGLSSERADARIATLDGPELRMLADQARAANQELAGGSLKTRLAIASIIVFVIVVILVSI